MYTNCFHQAKGHAYRRVPFVVRHICAQPVRPYYAEV
jgi:hypothetical protein